MPLIITTKNSGSSSSGVDLKNIATLRKLNTDSDGNLTFDGKTIAANSLETALNVTLTKELIQNKFIELPHDCDTSQIITLSIQGILMQENIDWEVREKTYPEKDLIAWDGLGLQHIAQVGDKISISYYRR